MLKSSDKNRGPLRMLKSSDNDELKKKTLYKF